MKRNILTYLFIACLLILAKRSTAQTVGVLYGMSSAQTLYSYDPISGRDSLLVKFNGLNGVTPLGNLLQATNGRLYGMTSQGGAIWKGVLFYYDITNGKDSTIFSFVGPNGASPSGSLIQASNGLLYGMTPLGGAWNDGVIFSYNLVTGKDTVLFNFNDTNGANPGGSLVQAKDGKLYGMTQYGGSNADGVIFSFDPVLGKDSVLINFNGSNGSKPVYGNLVQDTDGLLYGTTQYGGLGAGALFSFDPVTGKDTVLVQFMSNLGFFPYASLTHDSNGVLYGMTFNGGLPNTGVLFSYNPASSKDSILFNFNYNSIYGGFPEGTPLLASNGLLYGIATQRDSGWDGTLYGFNLTINKYSVLVSFDNTVAGNPIDGLIEAMGVYQTGEDSVFCFGDSGAWAKLNVRGAKMPVTYLWNNGATTDSIGNLKAGGYTCKITDARGITLTDSIRIFQPSKLILSSSVSAVCFGDSNGIASVSISGGNAPYKYKWNNGATTDSIFGLKPGKDSCVVTDAKGCSSSVVDVITQAAQFKIDSIVTTPSSCPACVDGTVKVYVSGGIPAGDSAVPGYPYLYSWTPGGDSITISDTLTIRGLAQGGIIVNVSNACGLLQDSVTVPLGISKIEAPGKSVLVYPIPSSGQISVAMQGSGFEMITISDELGNEVYKNALDASRDNYIIRPNLSQQPAGIYVLQITSSAGLITRKLIIQK